MTDLRAALTVWQKRLRLEDWRIVLRTDVRPQDMRVRDVTGETEWTESGKTAVIRIIGRKYYGERITPFDAEKTLVHELLHLKLCLLGESGNDLQDRYVHQLIDDLARALTDAQRAAAG